MRSTKAQLASLNVALQPSGNGRHLVRHVKPNEPFFYLGDTAWHLFQRLDETEVRFFLRNRAAKGFNAIMAVLVPEHGAFELSNRENQFPFYLTEDGQDRVPDVYRPNLQYFEFVDRVSAIATELGITLFLVPTWGRWLNGGLHGPPVIFDSDNAYSFANFLGKRYPFHPFILGGDTNRYWNVDVQKAIKGNNLSGVRVIDYGATIEAMARGLIDGEKEAIQALSPDLYDMTGGYTTFITYHSTQGWLPSAPEATSSAQFPKADWLSLDVIQSSHSDGEKPLNSNWFINRWHGRSSYQAIRKMYSTLRSDGHPRPVMDLEAHYENAHHWFAADQPYWTAADIRRGGWQAIFAGACGYTYGCNSVWQMHNWLSPKYPPVDTAENSGFVGKENWFEALDLPGAFQAGLMRQICLSLPQYFTRVPDSTFILSDTLEPDDGSPAGDRLIQGMRGTGWAMVHLPYGGTVRLDMRKALSDTRIECWKAWWIDPRTGGRELFQPAGNHEVHVSFTSSTTTKDDSDNDWLLYIETVSTTRSWFDRPL